MWETVLQLHQRINSFYNVNYIFLIRIVGVESNWVHSAPRPPIALLYMPWVIMRMENLVQWWVAGETGELGKNLPQCHVVHHKSYMTWSGAKAGLRSGNFVMVILYVGIKHRFRESFLLALWGPVVTICTTCFNVLKLFFFWPQTVFVCLIWCSQYTENISLTALTDCPCNRNTV
jgi:hypothetical protein